MIAVESFKEKVVQFLYPDPYLHYNSYKAANLGEASLDKLLKSQKTLFTQRFNALNRQGSQGRNFNQVKQLLKNWDTTGQNGADILSELQNIALFDNNGQATAYGTSGGVNVGNTNIANARSAFNTSKKAAMASINPIMKAIDNNIQSIIDVLADNNEFLLAVAIKETYLSGTKILPSDLNIPSDTSVDSNLLALSDTKLLETVATLSQNLQRLSELEGATLKAEPYRAAYSDIVGSIRSSLNSIGGTMHEIGFTLAALRAAQRGERLLQDTNKEISESVRRAGGAFTANWTAQDTDEDSGSETKDDVTITWDSGKAVLEFGATIKFRQGAAFRGSGPGSQALSVSGFIARQENLSSSLKKLERYTPNVTESAASMVAALGVDDPAEEWYQIKQRLGMLNLVDAISGSGIKGDFSAILVVNNRIFTILDILDRIEDTLAEIESYGGKGKGYTVEGAYLDRMRKTLSDLSQKDHYDLITKARIRNQGAWDLLQKTKLSISLNLGYLYSQAIFSEF